MTLLVLPALDWAEQNFGTCELGDCRRTRRLVRVGAMMADGPDSSTPRQFEEWSDLKAVYRLMDCDEVTFAAIARPHWQLTRQAARGTVLILGDTTQIDFSHHRASVRGLGPTGDGGGLGFLLHNALMVDPESRSVLGLAGQELFYRQPKPLGETSYQAAQRDTRESLVWGRLIDEIGSPAADVRYIQVLDRGADDLEVFCHLVQQRCDWVIRVAQLHRVVQDVRGATPEARLSVRKVLEHSPVLGHYELSLRSRGAVKARTARLEVRAAKVTLPRPQRRTPYQQLVGFESLTQWVVEAREVDVPESVTPLHWVLYTSLPVETLADARQAIGYYEQRWTIEEFHKALKTGCRLEDRQYETAERLERLTGLLSVLAVRLLQLKNLVVTDPQRPAEGSVPRSWLLMLRVLRRRPRPIETVRDFFRNLAGLGGFLLRKGDGEPGWQTLWAGLEKLLMALRGYHARAKCG